MEVSMTQEEIRRFTEAGSLQTPCYIFDEDELTGRMQQIKEALASCSAELCFAVKANPFLIPLLDPVVGKYEVCSPGELEICRSYGIAGDKIIFSGVVKSYDDIKTALAYPVGEITIESARHWQILKTCVPAGVKTRVLLRLTSGAQFGMEEQTIHAIIEEIQSMPDIVFAGIHFFAGTQRKGSKYEKELVMLAQFMTSLQEKYGLVDMRLEYGPGLCVAYFEGETVEEGAEEAQRLAEWIGGQHFPYPVTIELGRYLAASCGHYVTRIMDVKQAGERKYCLIDGGIHHINYYGQNMAMRTPVIHHIPAAGRKLEESDMGSEYMICGALCTFADLVARGLILHDPQIEDFLVFDRIGAYSVTEGSYLFLSRDLPRIYTYRKDTGIRKIRDRIAAWEINVAEHVREENAFCIKK